MTCVRDDTTTTASVKALLTSGVVTACFYAHRPHDRPRCEGLGVVRYGPTILCGDCDRRRSAVGAAFQRDAVEHRPAQERTEQDDRAEIAVGEQMRRCP